MKKWLVISCVTAIRFDMHVLDDERCFNEEIPRDTQQLWQYRVEYRDMKTQEYLKTAPGYGLRVNVKREAYGIEATKDTTLLSKVYGDEGTFTFTSAENGVHKICFKAESEKAQLFDMYRLHIHKKRGLNFSDMKTTEEDITEMGLRLMKLQEQTRQISSEQQFSRVRERTFRKTSTNVNDIVFWWGLIQVLFLVLVNVLYMAYMRHFFLSKKLV